MPRSVLPSLVGLVLAIAACGASQASPLTSVAPTPRGDCAVTTEPGPADEPDRGGGELDMTDFGGGRWRLCLTEPTAATVEHSAWCLWTADRTGVSEINGLPAKMGALYYDAGVSLPRNEFTFGTTAQDGLVATYDPGAVPAGDGSEDGRAGFLTFIVVLAVDPEGGAPPAGAEPRYAGMMRWQCGDPPPRR